MHTLAVMLAMLAADVCGPRGAETLARTAESRVYVTGGVAYGCHRERSRPVRIGTGVIGATLAGRRAVIRRSHARGEQLRMYDLRRGLAKEHIELAGAFETVRVDRAGLAVFVLRRDSGLRLVSTIRRGFLGRQAYTIEPGSLRLAASTIAWRQNGGVRVLRVKENRAPDTPLIALGDIRVSVRGERLVARRGTGASRALGTTATDCESSGGCAGIEELRAAGAYVAALETGWDRSSVSARLLVRDLDGGGLRSVCDHEREGLWSSHQITAFVVAESGGVACATVSGTLRRVRTAHTVLDEGPGIEPSSLVRRGDRIVWLHDGAERSAPLP